jgi:crotonobetainyl-CoA:carnitine CoA-transferase CaiB-like acyl-CoA transferase
MDSSMLAPYRVLDLADEKGVLCGKILGDLGADVIKIEKPGGDDSRNLGPFYQDEPHAEKSLFWFAMNTSKRSITLDVETADGRDIFARLAAGADFIIESFAPGYMDNLGLGYDSLAQMNPRIIMVSISPFGQSGPYRDWKGPDIVEWAMGGEMAPWGDPDRPPFRISHHSQSYMHAGADGAAGALMALQHRYRTGEGQQVDVSIQDSVSHCSDNIIPAWDLDGILRKRGEDARGGNHRATRIWKCKDGYVSWAHGGNSRLTPSLPLIRWMEKEGFKDEFLESFDWNRPNFNETTQEEMDRIEAPTGKFFLERTKAQLLEGAIKHGVMLYPVATTADMLQNVQLRERAFWARLEHAALGKTFTYPGSFVRTTETPARIRTVAPKIGEHNLQVYESELHIDRRQIIMLKQAGVI